MAVYFYAAAAQDQDSLYQCKTESAAAAASAGISLIKFIEYMAFDLFAHTDSGIRKYNLNRLVMFCQPDGNCAVFGSEFHGIGKKISPYLDLSLIHI